MACISGAQTPLHLPVLDRHPEGAAEIPQGCYSCPPPVLSRPAPLLPASIGLLACRDLICTRAVQAHTHSTVLPDHFLLQTSGSLTERRIREDESTRRKLHNTIEELKDEEGVVYERGILVPLSEGILSPSE